MARDGLGASVEGLCQISWRPAVAKKRTAAFFEFLDEIPVFHANSHYNFFADSGDCLRLEHFVEILKVCF